MGQQTFLITILLLLATAFAVASMQAAWLRRSTSGARPFFWMMSAAALWSLGAALEYASDSIPLKIFWAKFQYFGISTLPVFWLLFCLYFSQVDIQVNRRAQSFLPWLGLIPVATIVFAWTNSQHGLIWKDIATVSTIPRLQVEYIHGPWFWVLVTYNYILLVLGTASLGWSLTRFPRPFRRQSVFLVIGALIPWLANFLYLAGYRLAPGLDLTPVAFSITGVIYSFEVFRYRLLDLIPVAQDNVIESMTDGVVVTDESNRIMYINPAGRTILNLPDQGTKSNGAILPYWEDISKALRTNPGPSKDLQTAEITIDSERPRHIDVQVGPLYTARDRSAGKLILLRDITQQYQTEEQLLLQSVALSSAPNAIIITDRSGKIIWVNPAFITLTGFSMEEVIGNNPSILKSGQHNAEFYSRMWQTILAGTNWHGELINRKKDGTIYIEDTTIAPVKNSRGEVTNFIAIKQDITGRKELEKMRDDLMQAIVHDLRNPLNSILFSLDMVQRLPLVNQVPLEILSTIEISRENAWRMLGMINSILDLSRLESGSLPVVLENVVLAELVEQSIHAQSAIAQRREVLILNDVPYDLPPVAVDRFLIGRVLQNLLDNAIKFSDEGSNIEVSADYHPGTKTVTLSVRDEGPGIPPELQSAIFQKFITGPSPRRGTGLGLAFCRLAVEAHAGRIWVESKNGRGATFLLELPAPNT